MKRKNRMIWALILALSLSGCANAQTQTEDQQTEDQQTEMQQEETKQDGTEIEVTKDEEGDMELENEEETSGENGSETPAEAPVRIYGVISEVWAEQNTILVDNQSGNSSSGEMELIIDVENTLVLDASTGYPVPLDEVETGSFEAYLGQTMTASLPPQTTPYVVIVNIPADSGAPQYAVVASIGKNEQGGTTVTATDGREYIVTEETQVVPYRTKNIVTLEDIKVGSACLIWLDEGGAASKVQLFDMTEEEN